MLTKQQENPYFSGVNPSPLPKNFEKLFPLAYQIFNKKKVHKNKMRQQIYILEIIAC